MTLRRETDEAYAALGKRLVDGAEIVGAKHGHHVLRGQLGGEAVEAVVYLADAFGHQLLRRLGKASGRGLVHPAAEDDLPAREIASQAVGQLALDSAQPL